MSKLVNLVSRLREASWACLGESRFVPSAIAAAGQALGRPRRTELETWLPSELPRHAPLVVLVHGFGGSTAGWSTLRGALKDHDVAVAAFTYAPFGCSIEELVRDLTQEINQLITWWDPDSVVLVGHSLGGVLVARVLTDDRLSARVDQVVTIGAPFDGSPWASIFPIPGIVRELRTDSSSLRQAAAARLNGNVHWLSFTSPVDMIVPARRSVFSCVPVEHISVDGAGHCGMLRHPVVITRIVAAVADCRDRGNRLLVA